MAGKVKVYGVVELTEAFRALRSGTNMEKIAARATYGAATDLREFAKDNARREFREGTGALFRNIARKRMKKSSTLIGYTVGVKHGGKKQKATGDDPWYWWILEFGTNDGRIAPRAFFRNAYEQHKRAFGDMIVKQGMAAVIKAANSLAKKQAKSMSSRG
jgi:HK97 gp10 family phage protein